MAGDVAGIPPSRTLGLSGAPNFRDAGGYAVDGGRLAWGRLYRSGHLAGLTSADEAVLADLGLDLVIDLRRADERDLEPSKLPAGIAVFGAPITPGSQSSAIYGDATQLGGAQAKRPFRRGVCAAAGQRCPARAVALLGGQRPHGICPGHAPACPGCRP